MMFVPDGIDKEMQDVLYDCWTNMEVFCNTFMPMSFKKPFSAMHREVFKILDDDSIRMAAIAAPRDFGKTTIVNGAFPAKRILFRDSHYIIPVSATGSAAIEFSENLKTELLLNEDMVGVFGSITAQSTGMTSQKDPFSSLEWVTNTGIKVMPRGAGQQIRGRIFRRRRPDLYIIDDLEDDEAVESEERRFKLMKWFMSALKNSVEFSDPNWRIIVIGTILHEDSLLANLLNKEKFPSWTTLCLELCDDDCKSNWPEHMTTEQIKELKEEALKSGMIDLWYKEFRNIPIAIESRGFKPEYFQYYTETEKELTSNLDVITMVLADPARTMKQTSSKTAVVVVSVNTETEALYIRHIVEEMMNPDELYDEMLNLAEQYNALVLAPEVTGLHEYITYPLKNAMIRRNKHYIIVEVKPREGKTGPRRSGGLIPLYQKKLVWHSKEMTGKLERLLLMWPRPESWDIIDAVAGCIYVMDEGDIYFSPKNLKDEEIEEEYDELLNEPVIEQQSIC